MKKLTDSIASKDSDSPMSEYSHTIIKHSESSVNSQINLSEPFKNRLFVGVIDINK